jgi:hypothetical protein
VVKSTGSNTRTIGVTDYVIAAVNQEVRCRALFSARFGDRDHDFYVNGKAARDSDSAV